MAGGTRTSSWSPDYLILHDYAGRPNYYPNMHNPYNALVFPDGRVHYRNPANPYGSTAPHAYKMNPYSVGLSYADNIGAKPTEQGLAALRAELDKIKKLYPSIKIESHGEAYNRTRGSDLQASRDGRTLQEASWRSDLLNPQSPAGAVPTNVAEMNMPELMRQSLRSPHSPRMAEAGPPPSMPPSSPVPVPGRPRSLTQHAGLSGDAVMAPTPTMPTSAPDFGDVGAKRPPAPSPFQPAPAPSRLAANQGSTPPPLSAISGQGYTPPIPERFASMGQQVAPMMGQQMPSPQMAESSPTPSRRDPPARSAEAARSPIQQRMVSTQSIPVTDGIAGLSPSPSPAMAQRMPDSPTPTRRDPPARSKPPEPSYRMAQDLLPPNGAPGPQMAQLGPPPSLGGPAGLGMPGVNVDTPMAPFATVADPGTAAVAAASTPDVGGGMTMASMGDGGAGAAAAGAASAGAGAAGAMGGMGSPFGAIGGLISALAGGGKKQDDGSAEAHAAFNQQIEQDRLKKLAMSQQLMRRLRMSPFARA